MISVNDQNMSILEERGGRAPILVDCWSYRSEPCRYNAPVADEFSRRFGGRLQVAKLNVDEAPLALARFGVKVAPSMMLFHDGRLVGRFQGVADRGRLLEALAHLGCHPVE